jgi:hypothetical protein
MPAIFTLGREAEGAATLLMRFSLSLPKDAKIVEAYVLLSRSDGIDADPSPISLHATRIIDSWDSASVGWATQPRTEEVRTPSTRVDPVGRIVTRVDVRAIVERWALHDRRDQGIAILAENASPTGIAFAFLAPAALASGPPPLATPLGNPGVAFGPPAPAEVLGPAVETLGSPRLEIYVK